ncbi:MAG: DUF2283 domain-containing protein [Armatimonadetes bacterium CG07_land_8_20_14_0_80_40_9]|nr:MAG: DUF2283 domain-containing protein [Armatimonadetes bacterium CG07_land_8_20_14_0_80_40_9]
MKKMRIWYDQEGDMLEIGFGKRKGYMKDVGDDIWLRIEEDELKGFLILNFSKRVEKEKEIKIPVKISFA